MNTSVTLCLYVGSIQRKLSVHYYFCMPGELYTGELVVCLLCCVVYVHACVCVHVHACVCVHVHAYVCVCTSAVISNNI